MFATSSQGETDSNRHMYSTAEVLGQILLNYKWSGSVKFVLELKYWRSTNINNSDSRYTSSQWFVWQIKRFIHDVLFPVRSLLECQNLHYMPLK